MLNFTYYLEYRLWCVMTINIKICQYVIFINRKILVPQIHVLLQCFTVYPEKLYKWIPKIITEYVLKLE